MNEKFGCCRVFEWVSVDGVPLDKIVEHAIKTKCKKVFRYTEASGIAVMAESKKAAEDCLLDYFDDQMSVDNAISDIEFFSFSL